MIRQTNVKAHPTREQVERAAEIEGARVGIPAVVVLGASSAVLAVEARKRAIRRVLSETRCSTLGLALVWGIDRSTILRVKRTMSPSGLYREDEAA